MDDATEFHEEETLGKAYDARLMRRLLRYVRPYRGMVVLAVVLILVSSLLELVGPLATAVAIDLYIAPAEEVSETSSQASRWVGETLAAAGIQLAPEQGILGVSIVFLVSLVLGFVILYAQSLTLQLMGQYIMRDLRNQIFGRLQRLPVAFFDRNPIGRLVTRVTSDVDALNELFTAGLVSIIGDVMVLVGISAVLFWLNWQLALVSFAILPLLLVLTLWFKIRARQSFRDVRVRLARINAFLQEHIVGMSVLQLFGAERRALEGFANVNDRHRWANIRAIFYYSVYFPAVELITAIGVGLILWYGGLRVMGDVLSVGALIAFFQYAQRFYRPLADLSDKYNILQAAMAASERIFRLLDEPETIDTAPRPHRAEVVGDVEFEDVRFGYKPDEEVLHGVSLRVRPGEMVAVVGHTGAGKSTLANLLLRFYDVDSGAVRVDGVDLRQWDLASLRRGIGLVLQDVFLFSGTIGGNIRLGRGRLGKDGLEEEDLRAAAAEVQAIDFIDRLPEGFAAPVRERGAGLSVGQKQLISFARALAFDPKILILDEATSSVDTETEQLIQQALERLLAGRTSIVIAHRLSTIQRADRILVLHKGCLHEEGTHQELLARRGLYWKLYQLQYQGAERATA